MSAQTLTDDRPVAATVVEPYQLKIPIFLAVVTVVLTAIVALAPRSGLSRFRLTNASTAIQLPEIDVPGTAVQWICVAVIAILTIVSFAAALRRVRVGAWLPIVFAFFAMFGFLVWAGAGSKGSVVVASLLAGALSLSVPLVFGALGGVIGERAGVVNVAIEAQLLLGAFAAAIMSSITKNAFVGLIGAMIGGVIVAFVLAAFAIKYLVEQVIVGVVLNVLIGGLTTFLYGIWVEPHAAQLNTPATFPAWKVPLLGDIPIIGPVLFNQSAIVYIMYVAVAVVTFALYRTRWGLRLRAVGEYPKAADTVGIKVNPTRFWNVLLAGAVVGIGGAYFTLVSVPHFTENMTGGLGFIALAAVIFGRWDPLRATFAALLFGFAQNLQNTLTVLEAPVPKEFMYMLPYVVTIIAVAAFAGQITGPAASGKPYIKN